MRKRPGPEAFYAFLCPGQLFSCKVNVDMATSLRVLAGSFNFMPPLEWPRQPSGNSNLFESKTRRRPFVSSNHEAVSRTRRVSCIPTKPEQWVGAWVQNPRARAGEGAPLKQSGMPGIGFTKLRAMKAKRPTDADFSGDCKARHPRGCSAFCSLPPSAFHSVHE